MLDEKTTPSAGIPEAAEQLILVDEADRPIGPARKLEAHVSGDLHRAFSVFLFRSTGELLLQRRADSKYHSPGRWANTCCGHPRPFEDTVAAGERRLHEELGIRATLHSGFQARYKEALENGLIENELVHVLFGISDAAAVLNPDEASAVATIGLTVLEQNIRTTPDQFAIWIVRYFERHAAEIAEHRDRVIGTHTPR
ncbi:MAG: isopentenyl-diphosphate Delta-isomerase [Pseudomonadota bacterium]